MKIEIREITTENQQEIMNLHVKDSQSTYIETVTESLKDAKASLEYTPVALYSNNVLVGFAMYGLFENESRNGRVWLDRYFIDERFQGQGLGSAFLKYLLAHLEETYHCKKIYLSLYEDNKRALHLYQNFGFEFTGELDINGEKIMMRK